MKAAVYFGKNDVRVVDIEKPGCGPGEVRIAVQYCGVCGTDLHIFHGDGGAAPVPVGTVIGHEFSGYVDAVGEGVTEFKAGDRVSVDPNDWCGECYYCRNGKAHFCTNMKGYGTTYPGGFAEFVTVPKKQVYHLPDNLSFKAGCQSETTSCCVNGIDLCGIRSGDTVLVIGAGPIGLMMVQMARQAGAGKVLVSEIVKEKRDIALKLGADVAIDPKAEDLKAVIDRECENLDYVIEAAGTPFTQAQAIEVAGNCCTVLLFGLVAPETEIPLKTFRVFNRELKIVSSFINPYTFSRAIRLLAEKRVVLDDIITDVIPLENITEVFTNSEYRRHGKILIRTARD